MTYCRPLSYQVITYLDSSHFRWSLTLTPLISGDHWPWLLTYQVITDLDTCYIRWTLTFTPIISGEHWPWPLSYQVNTDLDPSHIRWPLTLTPLISGDHWPWPLSQQWCLRQDTGHRRPPYIIIISSINNKLLYKKYLFNISKQHKVFFQVCSTYFKNASSRLKVNL